MVPGFKFSPSNTVLSELLAATDVFAAENVRAGRGGPFGASIHVHDSRTGELTPVLGLRANAVLATGMASAHAEDQALTPDMVAALERILRSKDPATSSVIFSSSGESCPACHAKEEIAARYLLNRGCLLPGRFIVTYGATFLDAFNVAGFKDIEYAQDMQKPAGSGRIALTERPLESLPSPLKNIFARAAAPLAVIELPGKIYINGRDERANGDLMATPEMSAIRAASIFQKEQKSKTAFNLDEAILWTSTASPGPLAYATSQWANVTQINSVTGLPLSVVTDVEEAPGVKNADLFRAVAQPYNRPGSTITVLHITPFENRAQHVWKDTEHIEYNGI